MKSGWWCCGIVTRPHQQAHFSHPTAFLHSFNNMPGVTFHDYLAWKSSNADPATDPRGSLREYLQSLGSYEGVEGDYRYNYERQTWEFKPCIVQLMCLCGHYFHLRTVNRCVPDLCLRRDSQDREIATQTNQDGSRYYSPNNIDRFSDFDEAVPCVVAASVRITFSVETPSNNFSTICGLKISILRLAAPEIKIDDWCFKHNVTITKVTLMCNRLLIKKDAFAFSKIDKFAATSHGPNGHILIHRNAFATCNRLQVFKLKCDNDVRISNHCFEGSRRLLLFNLTTARLFLGNDDNLDEYSECIRPSSRLFSSSKGVRTNIKITGI